MSFTIGFIHTTAYGASPRSIFWVDQNNGHTHYLSFVCNFGPQVGKCPGGMLTPLTPFNRNSITDARKFFNVRSKLGIS